MAESANIYQKYVDERRLYRIPGAAFIVFGLVYLWWLAHNLNLSAPALSLPFFGAHVFIYIAFSLSIINHWRAKYRTKRPEMAVSPAVAVVVPTYKEPIEILYETVKSVLKINYPGEVVILVSNDDKSSKQKRKINQMMHKLAFFWESEGAKYSNGAARDLHMMHTNSHDDAKAGNLNQAISFFRTYYPHIDLVLTQDADETVDPDILAATVGYFTEKANVSFVQTIKQSKVSKSDPFGNNDLLWYARTAAARDADNAMFACGSGVVWRISALESVGGFCTWNLVEDLTTSYDLLAMGWEGRYHYEGLSEGHAPEDLGNYTKQRGTWALDTIRIFYWDNPLFKKSLSIKQKLQFLELPVFYFSGIFMIILLLSTAASLFLGVWPTTATGTEHAIALFPAFVAMELYYIMLAGTIPAKRVRQFRIGLSPVFVLASLKALLYGPNRKPRYKVTVKQNRYGNYLWLAWPQVTILVLLVGGVTSAVVATPLYSRFDWAIVFWGLYQSSFYLQVVKVAIWKWTPALDFSYPYLPFLSHTKVGKSYSPETA